jgi:hypothetical protein
MPTTVACFHCGISAAVDLDQAPITIEYDHGEWERKCAMPGPEGITLCPNMRAILRVLRVQPEDPAGFVERRRRAGKE